MTADRPMRVIIAPQAFKGSLTATEVAEAIATEVAEAIAADGPRNLDDAMTHAAQLIRDAVARACRLWQVLPHESI